MHFHLLSFSFLVVVVIAGAPSNKTAPNKPDPCAVITLLATEFYSNSSSTSILEMELHLTSLTDSGKTFAFSPELGIQCLQSSAIDKDLASNYAEELKKYYEFQSTLAYLKGKLIDALLSVDITQS
jgi:hypothetical protein